MEIIALIIIPLAKYINALTASHTSPATGKNPITSIINCSWSNILSDLGDGHGCGSLAFTFFTGCTTFFTAFVDSLTIFTALETAEAIAPVVFDGTVVGFFTVFFFSSFLLLKILPTALITLFAALAMIDKMLLCPLGSTYLYWLFKQYVYRFWLVMLSCVPL